MLPEQALEEQQAESERHREAMSYLISDVKNDPDATKREKKLADALIALRES